MVPAHLYSSGPNFAGSQNSNAAASHLAAPTSPDEDAVEVGSEGAVHGGLAPAPVNQSPSLLEATVSHPFPLPPVSSPTLPSPFHETQPELDINLVGCAISSADLSLPTPSIVKAGRDLRLPSFELLGIAAPHPDRLPLPSNSSFSFLGAGPLSKPDDPLHALSPALSRPHHFGGVGDPPTASPEASRAQVEHLVPVVTPPADPEAFKWGTFVNVRTAGLGSPPTSDPGVSPGSNVTASASSPALTAALTMPNPLELGEQPTMETWVEKVKGLIASNFSPNSADSVVKVLSHALPCPSHAGHVFVHVIAAVHDQTNASTSWINVFHAVSGRFSLADLPKSPPSTPGPAVGGDSYFTSKVFDSAVAVSDYQGDSKLMPPSPRPVVAPGSVDVSVVERYIPPTNVAEFAEMFSLKGNSLLVDRLVELSPQNGTLLFIYPTKTGARTFMNEYLGPVLDPLLRSMAVIHNLSSDLGTQLGSMGSVDQLAEYGPLTNAMKKFCAQLSDGSTEKVKAIHQKAKYTLIHESKEEVPFERDVWASDWWIKQEKPHVRNVVTKCFKTAARRISGEGTPANLIQEILDGVAHKEYEGSAPTKGIEVGVYVIQKSF